MTLVYIDTETTGLDPALHSIWEIAYAVEEGPVQSSFVSHGAEHADPTALRLNGYYDRFKGEPFLGLRFEADLREALTGSTLVAANPAFDTAFLRARWGVTPWKYRLLDVEAYAMGALGFDEPRGLKDVSMALRERGFVIPEPDHTAAADVETLRACHLSLRALYRGARLDQHFRPVLEGL